MSDLTDPWHFPRPGLAQAYHVASLGVFGSYVRREAGPTSDLDLLVTFSEPPGLFGFVELEQLLSDRLGVKVDLVMADALKPRIGRRVMQEVVQV